MLNELNFVVLRTASARALFNFFAPSMLSLVRLLLRRLFFIMPFPYASFVLAFLRALLDRVGRFLFFLVGAGFLSVALIACEGNGLGEGSPSSPRAAIAQSPGQEGGSSRSPRDFEVELTFAPMMGGFHISNQSTFSNFVSLSIRATRGSELEERNIDLAEFADGSYDFTGLDDQADWTFRIIGTLSDGEEQEVTIVFVWEENREDHESGGIRSGINTDGDGRADSVDEDDDNDGIGDSAGDACPTGKTGWTSDSSTDNDGDGCRDESEDIDDDGDGLIEIATAAELDAVRYALNGNGSKLLEDAALDTTGCGGVRGLRSCNGYELIADISLLNYANADGGKGWQPLGHDTDGSTVGCQGESFAGTFEGNGWTISDLSINRLGENCVGLFGRTAMASEIRNLTLRAERVIGGNFVGGLIGDGESARIHSSSVEAAEVRGSSSVGGLIGYGGSARIHFSSVVAVEVSGSSSVGGLVGFGGSARIYSSSVGAGVVRGSRGDNIGGLVGYGEGVWIDSSSVVAAEVRGSGTGDNVGGLVGNGGLAQIYSSSVVATEVSGRSSLGGLVGRGSGARVHSSSVVGGEVSGTGINVGGLVGSGGRARIVSSSIVVGEVSGLVGSSSVGGLVGNFGSSQSAGQVAYSYVVSGSNTAMLVGSGSGTGVASYWDSETSGINNGNYGQAKTSDELHMPIDYTGIYTAWNDDTDIFGDGEDVPLAVWCDKDNSGSIEADERTNDNRVWDFGTSNDYPAIRCTPLAPTEWRSWWFLNGTGKPQLNQTRLVDTDGDGLVDRVDRDDDNDGAGDNSDQCPVGETGWTSDPFTDKDGDGCRDASEDTDDDNDGVGDTSDQCPVGETGWTSDSSTDKDGDGCHDESKDIDDDGDGLIEIATAAELNLVRYALNGNGIKLSETAALDTTGCGGDSGITSCSGYELVADISLAAYSNGEGWQPLGHDTDSSTVGCQGAAFNGTFEGNGFRISDLSINRSGEDCVGLFGHITAGSEIHNLTLIIAGAVIGRGNVGGLVGDGPSARIISSSVVASQVIGTDSVGGLVGLGSSAWIHFSSVVVNEVSGAGDDVGGLTGEGIGAWIYSSSVVVGEVSGSGSSVGGLVGRGETAQIHSSSVVVGEVSGSGSSVGGLVGRGETAQIYSSLVVADQVSGSSQVGGVVGYFDNGKIAYSYVVSGSNTAMLVGSGHGATGVASYWDSETSGINSGNHGQAKASDELRSPTGYDGIYADWDEDMDIFGDEDEPLAVWCDKDNSGSIEEEEKNDDNRIWDFGTSSQYPAIRCTPTTPTEWRSWWSLNETGKPQLDQTRLVDTDGDGLVNDVDEDDDNDGIRDREGDTCPAGEIGWKSNSLTDYDGDGCRDAGEDADDDNDGVRDGDEAAECVLDSDCDGDSVVDGEDIDDDGDGLIEIATAEELDAVRYALNGNGRRLSEDAALNTTGCGGDGSTTSCNGYELVADISLATYANADGGKGWQPLGHDTDSGTGQCQGAAFAGTFEGNGWTISDLSINRLSEDCVGLFGHIAEDSEIRNLTIRAETVIGEDSVGGLVGDGRSARIISSSVVADEVRGSGARVGGLVGWGDSARIISSSVVADEVHGSGTTVGGLVGRGSNIRIISSSVVVGKLSGTSNRRNGLVEIGGLVGQGHLAWIVSSSVVVGKLSGTSNWIGGLVGHGNRAQIFSSSVVVGEVSGDGDVGGLAGGFNLGRVAYSYVVSGNSTAMLVKGGRGTGVASYWDNDTSGINSGNHGQAKTSDELRGPTGYEGIYAAWDEYINMFGNEGEPLAVWCDKDHSGNLTAGERIDDNLIWDFGTSSQYPAIRCTSTTPAEWRSWWFLDDDGKPQLDRDRLDRMLPSFKDSDKDGIGDDSDQCPTGETGWTSNGSTDNDGDGCRDAGEDADDDNDGLDDTDVREQQNNSNGVSCSLLADCDGDTVRDIDEAAANCVIRIDCDGDGVDDGSDQCPAGVTGWSSRASTDYDEDGCHDIFEDTDDDNDGVVDTSDDCPRRDIGWTSSGSTDYDGDGCRDDGEDRDDDNDGVADTSDDCPRGDIGWTSRGSTDRDGDGCRDDGEDTDDDNDGVVDTSDDCPRGDIGWTSRVPTTDRDGDGCRDDGEDRDDDNDGIADNSDDCPRGNTGWISSSSTDYDGDGCRDDEEDTDDDDDRVQDGDEAAGCRLNSDCDGDTVMDDADKDDDGDGLIEIATAAGLNAVRYALDGEGVRLSNTGRLNDAGCGDGINIRSCNGYELVADISLVDYPNWQPLGHDTDSSASGCQGPAFDGIFDGNGWTISDLSINRPGEDCVGLFGEMDGYSRIRNIRLSAESVIGRHRVGALVGRGGSQARIYSSSVVVDEVSGRSRVGGLVGSFWRSYVRSSSVVASQVSGSSSVGGLVGWGESTDVIGSSVVVDQVSGTYDWVGGLIGWGKWTRTYSSSAVTNEVSGGGRSIGGLVGSGYRSLVHSSSVVVGELSGSSRVGGLTGYFDDGSVVYSYVISGSNTAMLVGYSGTGGVSSYWDSDTSGRLSGRHGQAKTSAELRSPTGYVGIYANWDNRLRFRTYRGYETVPQTAIWCDRDNTGNIGTAEQTNDNRVWDFGTSSQYPAIRCTPISPAEWRSWWSFDTRNNPVINQARLDALIP